VTYSIYYKDNSNLVKTRYKIAVFHKNEEAKTPNADDMICKGPLEYGIKLTQHH